ncbi:MAG: response regulator [Lachnospiraceae bacterium]|nr:response regulator [Lachnospiraceae bacterium]
MSDKKTILMVDDVTLNHATARSVLEDTYDLVEASSGEEAFEVLKKTTPDLILLDVIMPDMNGMEVLKKLKSIPAYKDIPVVFLTADTSPEAEVEGFQLGIVDYITKPFVPMVMKKRIETQIELASYKKNLEESVSKKIQEIEKMYDLVTVSFAGLVESRDGVTGVHLKNTSIYFQAFISHLKTVAKYRQYLPPSVVKKACRCAPLHDVGKIAIRDSVLQKPASLSADEFENMKLHAVIGGELFDYLEKRIPDAEFANIASQIAKSHHERWDGKGYPYGLKGEEIPLLARIMSIVDVYDAMTSKRPYKEPISHEKTMSFIASNSGTQFDPSLVNEFLNISNVIKECLETKEQMIEKKQYFSMKDYIDHDALEKSPDN